LSRLKRCPSKRRAKSGEQLVYAEWFGYEIVRTNVQGLDFDFFFTLG